MWLARRPHDVDSDGAETALGEDLHSILEVSEPDAGKRIDVFIATHMAGVSRSMAKRLIESGKVSVAVGNSSILPKPSYEVKAGDVISIRVPPPEPAEVVPQDIPIDIIYEDSSVIVVNKPRGLVVHPAPGNRDGTLVNALLFHCSDLAGVGGVQRPGIVHRLDKDTSGLMVVAKDNLAYLGLVSQIKMHRVKREYIAIVHGAVKPDSGSIDAPIGRHPVDRKRMAVVNKGGRPAVTHFRVIHRFDDFTVVRCTLETGRTHQIRVHMSFIGHPVVGDPVYSRRKNPFQISGQALHSAHLEFDHPRTGERMAFDADIPEDMQKIVRYLSQTRKTGSSDQ